MSPRVRFQILVTAAFCALVYAVFGAMAADFGHTVAERSMVPWEHPAVSLVTFGAGVLTWFISGIFHDDCFRGRG